MFRLDRLLEISDGAVIDADLGADGSLCYIHSGHGVCSLIVAAEEWSSWNQSKLPHATHLRWMSKDRVALWSLPPKVGSNNTVRVYVRKGSVELPVGQPRDVIFGTNVLFACYGEEAYLAAGEREIESHLIAAFDDNGEFQFGLRDRLKAGEIDGAIEMDVGCISKDNEGIFLFYPGDDLWRMSPNNGKVERLHSPANVRGLSAISAAEDKIFLARASASEISFGHFNLGSGAIGEDGKIPYSSLGIISADRRKHFRVHGCANGTMLITTDTGIWCVTFF